MSCGCGQPDCGVCTEEVEVQVEAQEVLLEVQETTSEAQALVEEATLDLEVQETLASVEVQETAVDVLVESVESVLVEVGVPGPRGAPGRDADLVCKILPDATLSYIAGRLDRVDYADGRYKTLAYNGSGQLVTVDCVDPSIPQTVQKALAYTGGLLTSVTTTVT